VSNISTVSGGSIIGAYYAEGGAPEEFVRAVGSGDFNLLRETVKVQNLLRLLPGFGLIDRTGVQSELLDRLLLHGQRASKDSGPDQPRLVLGATDLQSGQIVGLSSEGVLLRDLPALCDKQDCTESFPAVLESAPLFIPRSEGGFPGERTRLSDLVATSGAFPIAFPPTRIEVTHQVTDLSASIDPTGQRRQITVTRRFVLSDGGLSDNSGIRLLLDAGQLGRQMAANSYKMQRRWAALTLCVSWT